MKDAINIGILGLGVVGSGTVALLEQNRAMIEQKVGARLHVRRIAVRDLHKKRADFDTVLQEAQARGYAEADPSSDVEGFDAQYKIAILSSIAFTSRVNVGDVYVEGITRITARDIECARELGYVIKLVGIAQ